MEQIQFQLHLYEEIEKYDDLFKIGLDPLKALELLTDMNINEYQSEKCSEIFMQTIHQCKDVSEIKEVKTTNDDEVLLKHFTIAYRLITYYIRNYYELYLETRFLRTLLHHISPLDSNKEEENKRKLEDQELLKYLEKLKVYQQEVYDGLDEEYVSDEFDVISTVTNIMYRLIQILDLTDVEAIKLCHLLLNGLLVSLGFFPVIVIEGFLDCITDINNHKSEVLDEKRFERFLYSIIVAMNASYDYYMSQKFMEESQETCSVKSF